MERPEEEGVYLFQVICDGSVIGGGEGVIFGLFLLEVINVWHLKVILKHMEPSQNCGQF